MLQDRLPQAHVYRAWNVAALGDPAPRPPRPGRRRPGRRPQLAPLPAARLRRPDRHRRVGVRPLAAKFGSLFILQATAQPGQDLAAVKAVLDEELGAFLESGPTAAELARAQTRRRASFVRGVERIGGFGGKSDVLAQSKVYVGSPDGHLRTQQNIIARRPPGRCRRRRRHPGRARARPRGAIRGLGARRRAPQERRRVDRQAGTVVYLIDRPDSEQSIIFAGHVAPPSGDPRNLQIAAMNNVLGGEGFTGRINMNLREDKGWSYGAQSQIIDTAGQRPFPRPRPRPDRPDGRVHGRDRPRDQQHPSRRRPAADGRRARPRQGPSAP